MKRLWGRKVSDIAPYALHLKLQHQSQKHGKELCYIHRFEPTSKTCSHCGQLDMFITLDVREWQCSGSKRKHHRDVNAAINIIKVGETSTLSVRASICNTVADGNGFGDNQGSSPKPSPVRGLEGKLQLGINY